MSAFHAQISATKELKRIADALEARDKPSNPNLASVFMASVTASELDSVEDHNDCIGFGCGLFDLSNTQDTVVINKLVALSNEPKLLELSLIHI